MGGVVVGLGEVAGQAGLAVSDRESCVGAVEAPRTSQARHDASANAIPSAARLLGRGAIRGNTTITAAFSALVSAVRVCFELGLSISSRRRVCCGWADINTTRRVSRRPFAFVPSGGLQDCSCTSIPWLLSRRRLAISKSKFPTIASQSKHQLIGD